MANDNQEYFPSIRKVVGASGSVGTQTGTTAPVGTNTNQIATTAFVLANAGGGGGTPKALKIASRRR